MLRGRERIESPGSTFDEMYRSELPSMIALALSMAGDKDTAVDLAHEAMLRAYRNWPSVGAMDRPGAWVRRVLINLAIDAHRRSSRHPLIALVGDERAHRSIEEPSTSAFWTLVRELPDRQRAAVALRYLEDMAVADIAAVLRVSEGTVKKSLFEARKSLAASLEAQGVDDEDH